MSLRNLFESELNEDKREWSIASMNPGDVKEYAGTGFVTVTDIYVDKFLKAFDKAGLKNMRKAYESKMRLEGASMTEVNIDDPEDDTSEILFHVGPGKIEYAFGTAWQYNKQFDTTKILKTIAQTK